MNWRQYFIQPKTLEERKLYLLRLSPYCQDKPEFMQVRFVSYTACPAVVVVEDGTQVRFTCERSNLYEMKERSEYFSQVISRAAKIGRQASSH